MIFHPKFFLTIPVISGLIPIIMQKDRNNLFAWWWPVDKLDR